MPKNMHNINFVKKRNGRLDPYNPDKINRTAIRACQGLEGVSPSEVVLNAEFKLHDKISTEEIDTALILSARERIQYEPNYSYVAARITLNTIYRETFSDNVDAQTFDYDYRVAFRAGIRTGIKKGLLQSAMSKFDLTKLSNALDISMDDKFKFLGIDTIKQRYLLRDGKTLLETPQAMWMRVAMGLALNEQDCDDWAIAFYNVMSQMLYTPSTPTLFNSGLKHSQLSSCYLNTFDDSIDGIFDGLWQEARKSKYAGGLGFDVTNFRAAGASIDGTPSICNGAIPWLRLFNDLLIAVNQKGKRPGAGCAYMEVWHKDFPRFLDLKKNTGDERMRTHDLNIAAWTCDEFMRRVRANDDWYLFCPNDAKDLHRLYGAAFSARYAEYIEMAKRGEITNFTAIKAKDLWKRMIASLFETSHPWITFKDPCNSRYANQHVGVVNSSNLCTEITLHTVASKFDGYTGQKTEVGETAVCNLGSINCPNHLVYDKQGVADVDWTKLANTIAIARRMLDNVIDINYYPTPEAKKSNLAHRPVGLGVMGLQDMLHVLDITIDSQQAIQFNNDLFEFISGHAIKQGALLAKERGAYSTYKGSLWDQGMFPFDTYTEHMRNDHAVTLFNSHFPEALKQPPVLTDLWNEVRSLVKEYGVRNSVCMAIAPTATIGDINGVEQSIEPSPSVLFVRENLGGQYTIINDAFVRDLKTLGLWTPQLTDAINLANGDLEQLDLPEAIKRKYASVQNRDMIALIKCNAARQKWIDQAISFNIYYFGDDSKEISDIYFAAWDYGLKTTYYLRGDSATEIEKASVGSQTQLTSVEPKQCSIDAMRRGEICESCQ